MNPLLHIAGALAISGDGAFMAAIPPSAAHCYILELVAGNHIIQHAAVKPETPPEPSRGSDVQRTHCALSYSGNHVAVAVSNGYVWVFDR